MVVLWSGIKKHTLERNLMNVMFLGSDFQMVVKLLVIKGHTVERNIVNVMIISRDLVNQVIKQHI